MLWRALKHVENGFYIDIGAQDPVVDSVSLAFYERGWRGIHVEPVLDYANKLAAARPDETIIPAAVGRDSGLLNFFTFPDTGLSTANSIIAQRHQKNGFQCVETKVPFISLDEILETNSDRPVHWLKLDVEGTEKNALESWKKSSVRPWILVIESTLPLTQEQSHQKWENLVLSNNYAFVYFDGLNRYYVSTEHPELKSAFAIAPNVFDGFSFYHDSRFWTVDNESFRKRETQSGSQLYRCVVKIESLSNELSECNTHVEALKQDVLEQDQTISHLSNELSECNTHVEALMQDVRERDGTISHLSDELSKRNAHAEALMQDCHAHAFEVEQLSQKISDLINQEQISKLSAHHWWQEYRNLHMELESLKNTLAAVCESRSWRITSPLRRLKTLFFLKFWCCIKIKSKKALRKSAAYVNRHPILRRMALRIIHRIPRMKFWLIRTIGQMPMQPDLKNTVIKKNKTKEENKMTSNKNIFHENKMPANIHYLTPQTQHVYKILKFELTCKFGKMH